MRYAVYHLPPRDSLLARSGAAWLGWDVHNGEAIAAPPYVKPHWVATPRAYGFHATLKPPFRLAGGKDEATLLRAVEGLADGLRPVSLGRLRLDELGRFLAFAAPDADAALETLAAACVTELDRFRAPAGEDELGRRRAAGLDETEDANLVRWGYPYVLDRFRFHMTVTAALDKPDRDEAKRIAEDHFGVATAETASVSALSVLRQVAADAPFQEIAHFELCGR